MKPLAFLFGFVGMLGVMWLGYASGQDPVLIRDYRPISGSSVHVTVNETTVIEFTASDTKEKKTGKTGKTLEYDEDILRVNADILVTKAKRHYKKAVVSSEDKDTTLKIEGKLIQIEETSLDRWAYLQVDRSGQRIAAVSKLDPIAHELLDNEFAKAGRERPTELLHSNGVAKEGSSWPLKPEKLSSLFKDNEFTVVNPTGTFKVVKLDKLTKDPKKPEPKPTGKIEVTITASLGKSDKGSIHVREGTLTMTLICVGVLDGSIPQGTMDTTLKIVAAAAVNGVEGNLDVAITEKRTIAPKDKK